MAAVISRFLIPGVHHGTCKPQWPTYFPELVIRSFAVNTTARIHSLKKGGSKRQELMSIWWWIGLAAIALIGLCIWGNWGDLERRRAVWSEAKSYEPPNIHGKAEFPNDEKLMAKRFEPVGIPVGISQESGRTIFHRESTPILTIGKNGSLKSTSAIQAALLSPSLGKYSVIILDTTGEHTTVCAEYRSRFGPVDIINPCEIFTKELKRWVPFSRWNPIGPHWLDPKSPLFSSRAGAVAAPIFPHVEGHNRYFYDSPRNALKTLCMVQAKYGKPGQCNLPFIAREIINGPGGIFGYARHMLPLIDDGFLRSQLQRFAAANAESAKSIMEFMETAVTEMDFLNDHAVANCLGGESDVTFSMCKQKVRTIFVVLPLEVLAGGLGKLLKLTLSCINNELMREDGTGPVPTLVIADELYALLQGQVDSGLDVTWSASRKYNFQLWACIHDLSQLKDLFPKTYETFINNAGAQQWLSASDVSGSEYLSKLLGDREVYGFSKSLNLHVGTDYSDAPTDQDLRKLGITHNNSQHSRRLLLPAEIRQDLGPREQILVLEGLPPIRAGKRPYFEDNAMLRRAQPNPFFRGDK